MLCSVARGQRAVEVALILLPLEPAVLAELHSNPSRSKFVGSLILLLVQHVYLLIHAVSGRSAGER